MPSASTSPPDDVTRLFRRLVENIAALDPTRLSRPFPVAEVAGSLVPYRTHRTVLGFDTSEDYEMAVLRFLAGEGGFAAVEPPEIQEAFGREIVSVNPDPGMFHRFGGASVRLDQDQVASVLGAGPEAPTLEPVDAPEPASPGPVAITEPVFTAAPRDPAEIDDHPQLPFSLVEEPEDAPPAARPRAPAPGSDCPYCGGELPVGRAVMFCPHCGQNVGVVHCPTCGSELDVGWRFCITCGQKFSGGVG